MSKFGSPIDNEPTRVGGKYFIAKCFEGGKFKINPGKARTFHDADELEAFMANKGAWGDDSYFFEEVFIRQPERWFVDKAEFEACCEYQRMLVGLPAQK